jgi:hypothetical protein
MTPEDLSTSLMDVFPGAVQTLSPGSFQIETPDFRLLVLLSEDQTWLRVLLPIAPTQDAQPFLEELLEANFDETQETRYAFHQDVVWSVFQHSLTGLTQADLNSAIQRMVLLKQQGMNPVFNQFVEKQIRQIVQISKQQGLSLESTLQTLERFYQEGVMGELEMGARSREETMAAWQQQLERLWNEVEP